jgi:hypothetical protein
MIGCHSCVFSDLDCRIASPTPGRFGCSGRNSGAIGLLFERFDATLRQSGYIAMAGQIVDASLIAAPRQRNTQDEKKAIKDGRIPDAWKDKPAKLRRKDRDARWTVKYTKAKPREDGSTPPVDLAIPVFGMGIATVTMMTKTEAIPLLTWNQDTALRSPRDY